MDRVNLHVDADIVCGDCALVMMRNDYARGEPMAAAVTRATYETACATYGREKVDQVIANLGIQVDDPPSSQ